MNTIQIITCALAVISVLVAIFATWVCLKVDQNTKRLEDRIRIRYSAHNGEE